MFVSFVELVSQSALEIEVISRSGFDQSGGADVFVGRSNPSREHPTTPTLKRIP
jgi:hypothetical protein